MAPIVPSNIGFCKVVGQFSVTDLQGADADGKPNFEPWAEKWIKCTPVPKKLTDLTNTPNALAIKTTTITLFTDDNGQVVGDINPSNKWGWLVGSDDGDLNPHGWDYKFEFEDDDFPVVYGLAPQGGTILLPALIDTVGDAGELTGPAQAAAAAAASSASAAATSAASIARGVANGVAGLNASGNVINAAGVEVLPGGGSGGGLGSVTLTGTPTAGQVPKASSGTAAAWSTLAKGDVGLSNVDNTSDALKPASTTQAALNTSLGNSITTLNSGMGTANANISDLQAAVSSLVTDFGSLSGVVAAITALTAYAPIWWDTDVPGPTGVYAPRPNTTSQPKRPVIWANPDVEVPRTGTIAGGTVAAVVNVDAWTW